MKLSPWIEVISEQQLEVEQLLALETSIDRENSDLYLSFIEDPLIKIICGIRRSGKSFFSTHSLPKNSWIYLNFDDERLINLGTTDLNALYMAMVQVKPNAKYFIFDEIQNIEGWDLFVNRLKRKNLNLIITGSNGKLLSKEISTHLTGRHLNLEIYPYSFNEYLKFHKIVDSKNLILQFDDYLKNGAFPEVQYLKNKYQYLRDLYDRIISRDIIQRYEIRSALGLKNLALFLMNNVSKEFSYKKAVESLKISSMTTVKKYVQYLNDCYLFFELECYSHKIRERMTKPRKIYCIDTGMYNSLQSSFSQNQGLQLENLVFLQLKRKQKEFYYYKTPKYEIDFLVLDSQKKFEQCIQVCFSIEKKETLDRELNGLIKASVEFKCDYLLLLTYNEEQEISFHDKKIIIMPVWKWLRNF